MEITLLGTGPSAGVPMIGCDCTVCTSTNPKNKRTRASILIKYNNTSILVDTSPDLRQQALANNITHIDAVFYTHAHADHTHGLDEIRSFNYVQDAPIDAYGDQATFAELQQRFGYAFAPASSPGWFKPQLIPNIITAGDKITIKDITLQTFSQYHGNGQVIGLRSGTMAYSTDVNLLPDHSLELLQGLDVWIVDCLRYMSHPTHAHLGLVLEWVEKIHPKQVILTHMNHEFDYETLSREIPSNILPGYDGMVINI